MARKTKSESAQTRERILDAAEVEMEARGVSQTSLERIAKRAAVTRGAIYWHFADKSALLQAMISRTALPLRDLRQCLSQHIPGDEPLRLLREMLLHGLHRLAGDQKHRRVCHIILHRCEITAQGHPAEALLSAMFEESREVLLSLCREIERLGQLRPGLTVDAATDVLMAFMSGNYECTLRHPGLYEVDRDWDAIVDSVLFGLFDTTVIAPRSDLAAG
ncbi:TetR family transcriptional regulator [Salinisphaera orenii]|uniref:TetR family transcriptional regulator n=1 Tax=Salinisphaera orenii YIM 95161 TaxID=1051139 RepID=A0A423PX90_9GAMM|nr:TetR family transcriptional regulator [Salinisphaera halophila]ROO30228.1 TetR family transcriptional regulator [Salinisphaera halophila YIM 95161]